MLTELPPELKNCLKEHSIEIVNLSHGSYRGHDQPEVALIEFALSEEGPLETTNLTIISPDGRRMPQLTTKQKEELEMHYSKLIEPHLGSLDSVSYQFVLRPSKNALYLQLFLFLEYPKTP